MPREQNYLHLKKAGVEESLGYIVITSTKFILLSESHSFMFE